MNRQASQIATKVMYALAMALAATIMLPSAAFAIDGTQKVTSEWVGVDMYNYALRSTVTVENEVLVDVEISAVGRSGDSNYGGAVPKRHKSYYELGKNLGYLIADEEFSAYNPEGVDSVDVISGATYTSDTVKEATKQALVKWAESVQAQESVINMIEALPAETDQAVAVAQARIAYDALSEDFRTGVPERVYAVLTNAEAAPVVEAIESIALAADMQVAVEKARAAYDSLNADAQATILADVYKQLTDAEKKLADAEKAGQVEKLIAAIASSVSIDDDAVVNKARAAYDALAADQKTFIPEEIYAKLVAAEKVISDAKKAAEAAAAEANLANGSIKLSKTNYTFANVAYKPGVTVKSTSGKTLKNDTDYTVAYKNNTKVGKATVTVTGKGAYNGSKSATFTIAKAKQTIKAAKTYTVKVKNVKKKAQKLSVKFKASGNGKVTYTAAKTAGGKVSIAKNGKVTVKKGTKKGTYTLKVKVTAAAKGNYAKTTVKNVKLVVKVK